ncbi:MAG: hypothetical protein PVJ72_01160, partial [Gammaproteobacteria bacterium]
SVISVGKILPSSRNIVIIEERRDILLMICCRKKADPTVTTIMQMILYDISKTEMICRSQKCHGQQASLYA